MADSYKDILITPNRGNTADPKIEFRGANSSVNTSISLYSYHTSNGTLSFEGSAGQLFSITNDLSGSIFSVNDISGIPSIEVFDDGIVSLAQYSGNVGIGTASPYSKLHLTGDVTMGSGSNARPAFKISNWGYSSSYRVLMIGSASNTYTTSNTGAVTVAFNYDPSSNPNGSFTGDGHEILFRRGTRFLTPNTTDTGFDSSFILSDGQIDLVGGKIKFPASQLASSDANTLDDYEEGTWTPTVGGNATYIARSGFYRKIGSIVYINCYIYINNLGTGSSSTISGLPFAAHGSGSEHEHVFAVSKSQNLSVSVTWFALRNNGTTIYATYRTAASTSSTVNGAFLANTSELNFSGCYMAAN